MLLDPLGQSQVLVGRQKENTYVDPLDLPLDFNCVFVDNLPPKAKRNQGRDYSNSTEGKHDVGYHLTCHRTNSVFHIVELVNALESEMRHHHRQGTRGEPKGRVLLFEASSIFFVFLYVDSQENNEDSKEDEVKNGQAKFVLAEVTASVENGQVDLDTHVFEGGSMVVLDVIAVVLQFLKLVLLFIISNVKVIFKFRVIFFIIVFVIFVFVV